MIEIRDVTVAYAGASPLKKLSIELGCGSFALTGPSGSGKSTLLRVVAGLQRPDAGSVLIGGTAVATASWREAGDPRVAMIHQDYRLVPFLTVADNLLLAAELRGLASSRAAVRDALMRVALPSAMADRFPGTMSGGEQQRVAIARALMTEAPVILADEPTGALDADNTERVTDILAALGRGDGLTVVVATHDPSVAAAMGHHLALSAGRLQRALAA